MMKYKLNTLLIIFKQSYYKKISVVITSQIKLCLEINLSEKK